MLPKAIFLFLFNSVGLFPYNKFLEVEITSLWLFIMWIYSVGEESACNSGDPGSIPESGRSAGEGRGYPLQYTGLENSMENSIVHGVAKSWTWLSNSPSCEFILVFFQKHGTHFQCCWQNICNDSNNSNKLACFCLLSVYCVLNNVLSTLHNNPVC